MLRNEMRVAVRTSAERPRRLRLSEGIRRLVRENNLTVDDLMYPLFVQAGIDILSPIEALPGQFRRSPDKLRDEIREIVAQGIGAVILFGIPEHKDALGSDNFDRNGIIPTAIRTIKDIAPELIVVSDMCFCEYTDHGHCGIINHPSHQAYNRALPAGYLLNDATLELLAAASIIHAEAGADIIAPSGMIDGMVGTIRTALDQSGFEQTAIMSYAVKTASGFYSPFRHAADSTPSFGDRRQYQMDFANKREALREAALDISEGADILMVKPALPNLDIVSALHDAHHLPIAAYHVSGEYAMLQAAAQHGWIDLERCAMESLISIKRAGADIIVTYFAKDVVRWLG